MKSVFQKIREKMERLDVTQVWLILELRKRDVVVQPPEMSAILRGVCTYPKAKKVLEISDEILSDLERERTANE